MTFSRCVVLALTWAASASAAIPTVNLTCDVHGRDVLMPLVGAGSWQYNDTTAYDSICKAFAAGYTFLDTAWGYGNEAGVGAAIKDCWKGAREDLFVMTKIPGGLNASETAAAHRDNMAWLGLDYVDHLMTHFPADWYVTPERSSPARRQEEWRALEDIWSSGEARSIGVSHYCPQHLADVLEVATVQRPTVNQVEYHIGSGDIDGTIGACRDAGVYFMSFSPLCGPCDATPEDSLINGQLVGAVAAKYNVTGSQVSLRWLVQQALEQPFMAGVIPKSDDAAHLASNLDVFGFELSADDMATLSAATLPAAEGGDCDVP